MLRGYLPAAGSKFTIIDNDGTDPVIGTFAGLPEGATFTVSLDHPFHNTVTVDWRSVAGGTAAISDFGLANGTLTFLPGQTVKTILVDIYGDALIERNETFVVNLSNPNNAIITDNFGLGTIIDSDTQAIYAPSNQAPSPLDSTWDGDGIKTLTYGSGYRPYQPSTITDADGRIVQIACIRFW